MANPWDTESEADKLKVFNKWAASQDPEYITKCFCEHGSYVGFGAVFAYKCKGCNEASK